MTHQKYVLNIPCYRQVSEWRRYGLNVSDKTLSNWMIIASHDWLRPIYDLLRKELVLNQVLHADETRERAVAITILEGFQGYSIVMVILAIKISQIFHSLGVGHMSDESFSRYQEIMVKRKRQ